MPEIMETMLILYKGQHPNTVFTFRSLLNKHSALHSMGTTLNETALWTFLRGLKKALPSSLPLASFSLTDDAGDGDKVFANMLHYIKDNFQTSPDALTAYEAPKNERFLSPQMRLHDVRLLKEQLKTTQGHREIAALWDNIIQTCDILTREEALDAAKAYAAVARNSMDMEERAIFFEKSAQTYARVLKIEASPQTLEAAATSFRDAGFSAMTSSDKAFFFAESARLWDLLIAQEQNPMRLYLTEAVCAHELILMNTPDTNKKAIHYNAMANHLKKCLALTEKPDIMDIRKAALAHYNGAPSCANVGDQYAAYASSADFWDRYLANIKRPDAGDLHRACQAYDKLAQHAPTPEEKAHASLKSANLCDKLQKKLKAPDASDLRDMASVYCRAAIYARVDTDKQSYARKGARMWDKYFAKATNADPQTRALASSLYEQMASFAKTPGAKNRYLEKSASLKNTPEPNQTEASPAQGH
ncbi:MAG: hypothetical protein C0514_09260 [Candidatus Puniceispirillum sp.]|nr:hypothetical protein [Candidatus Puniceispirillum sp.]